MKSPFYLFVVIFLLALAASLIGVINNDIYRDGEWVNAQWFGQDLVILIGILPVFIAAAWFSMKKGSLKWRIALAGLLASLIYSYSFYVFAAKFTPLYFLHLSVFSLSLYGLITDIEPFTKGKSTFANQNKYIGIAVSVYIIAMAIMLSFLWISDLLSYLFINEYKSNTPDGEPPLIIYSLDLGIVIPLMIAGIIFFWKRKSKGFLITGIMLTKMTTIGFTLMGMSISMYYRHVLLDASLAFLWFILGFAGFALTILYFVYLKINVVSS